MCIRDRNKILWHILKGKFLKQEEIKDERIIKPPINKFLLVPKQENHTYIIVLTGTKDNFTIEVCLLYTSDAADDLTRVDLGGRRIIKKKKTPHPPPPPPDAPPPSLFFFFFSSRRRHTRFLYVSWARRCV